MQIFWIKSIGYTASAVNVVPSNSVLVLQQELRYIYFCYQSKCTDKLISAQKVMTFFPMLPLVKEYSERETNPMS